MKNAITTILTDAGSRSAGSVEVALVQQAEIAAPWTSVAD